jgi:hypothetical protein
MRRQQAVIQISAIARKTRRLVTISGYLRGFTIYKYRSTVIARSVATEANSNAHADGRTTKLTKQILITINV